MKKKILMGMLILICLLGFNICAIANDENTQPIQSRKQKLDNVDFGPYLENLQNSIKAKWIPAKSKTSNSVVLLFSLNKKGKVISSKVLESSGSELIDKAAIKALYKAAPFGKLPSEFKGEKIEIQFTFDYNIVSDKGKI
ncbi:TonB C-terminal domain-containing protein [bacterium]|nr:TonB C-terminal domain-containing protein [bacterium]